MSSKVVVVQLATPNIDQYAKYSIASVNQYCHRNGYRHFIQRSATIDNMHINWTKIDLLRKGLEIESDFTVLFDADVVLAQHDKRIESLVECYAKENTQIMMPRDTYFAFGEKRKRRPPRHIRPNAGFIILKNTDKAKSIVDEWLNQAVGDGKIYSDMHPRNQLVYWNFVMPKFLNSQVILPDHLTSNGKSVIPKMLKSKPFLYHIMMSNDQNRLKKMSDIYSEFCETTYLSKISKELSSKQEGLIEINKGIVK